MPVVCCQICNSSFYVKPNRIEKGWGKYCSNKCKHEGNKSGEIIPCALCSKNTYRIKSSESRSKSGLLFCGKTCQTIWRNTKLYVGENHSNWKNGESSYRDILKRTGIKRVCSKCKTKDVRILAVHHKDRDRKNNNASNLIWLCHNCHFLVHHFKDEAEGFLTA